MFRSFYLAIFALILVIQPAFACKVANYLKSPEGQQKMGSMLERSKSLIISKLEDLGIEEKDILITATLPKTLKGYEVENLTVKLNNPSLKKYKIWGGKIYLNKVQWKGKKNDVNDSVCGVSINFIGGFLKDEESSKDFGGLGEVTEFVRLD